MSPTAGAARAHWAAPPGGRMASLPRPSLYTSLVLGLGLLLRLVLLPLGGGRDFSIWSLTAAAALHGQDTYSAPPLPIASAGPYAYFPLYLYVLLPLKWLALHTGLPYLVLGKLPVMLGDVLVATALAAALRRVGRGERAAALGAALFFLNPLVLYNGAFYGRFDSLCLAPLLLAWRAVEGQGERGDGAADGAAGGRSRSWSQGRGRLAVWYALAVTLKTFPIVLLPYVVARVGRRHGLRVALVAVALPALVSLPYLLHDARRFLYIVFVYDSSKGPRQFSWQFALLDLGLSERSATIVSYGLLALLALLLLRMVSPHPRRLISHRWLWNLHPRPPGGRRASPRSVAPAARSTAESVRAVATGSSRRGVPFDHGRGSEGTALADTLDPYVYGAVAYALFLLLSKVVYEQYFLWPLPFLAILVVRDRSSVAVLLIVVLSVAGVLANPWLHPFGYSPVPALWLNVLIALVALLFVASCSSPRAAAGRMPGRAG